jgi:hypothetical protein
MPTLAKRHVQNTPVDNIHFAVAMLRWTLQIECNDCEELVKRLNALEKAAIAKAMK